MRCSLTRRSSYQTLLSFLPGFPLLPLFLPSFFAFSLGNLPCLPRSSQAHLAAHPYANSPADGTPLSPSGGVPLAGSGAQTPYYDAHATPPSSGPLAGAQQQAQGGQQVKAGPGQQMNGGYQDNDGAHGGSRSGGLRKFFCCG